MDSIHSYYQNFKDNQLYELRKTISGYNTKSDMAAATRFIEFILKVVRDEKVYSESASLVDCMFGNPIQEIWNKQASRWVHVESLANYFLSMALIFELVKKFSGPKNILSTGCGPGLYELFLEYELGNQIEHFYCSDASSNMIIELKGNKERYQKIYYKNSKIEPSVCNVELLEYNDESIDIVICNKVLHWCHDRNSALEQIGRVLKPQGIAIIIVPNDRFIEKNEISLAQRINSVELGAFMLARCSCKPILFQELKFPAPFGQNKRSIEDYIVVVKKQ